MYQSNLTQRDPSAASHITRGVVDQSEGMRYQAKAQRTQEQTQLALGVMEAGFAIDKSIQTKKMGEIQQEFSTTWAKEGLDAMSEEDREYVNEYVGELSLIDKGQLKPYIYKALAEKKFKEAAAKRPWLREELRSQSNATTGQSLAGSDRELSRQAGLLMEKRELQQQQVEQQMESEFFSRYGSLFGNANIDNYLRSLPAEMPLEEKLATFVQDPRHQDMLMVDSHNRELSAQLDAIDNNKGLDTREKDVKSSRVMEKFFESGKGNPVGQISAVFQQGMSTLDPESSKEAQAVLDGGGNFLQAFSVMNKQDQQRMRNHLRTQHQETSSNIRATFGAAGRNTPEAIETALNQAKDMLDDMDRIASQDPTALQDAEIKFKAGQAEMKLQALGILDDIKGIDRALYDSLALDMAYGQGMTSVGTSALTGALSERIEQGRKDQATGLLSAASLGQSIPTVVKNNPDMKEDWYKGRALAVASFSDPSRYTFEDLTQASKSIVNMEEGEWISIRNELQPSERREVLQTVANISEQRFRNISENFRGLEGVKVTQEDGLFMVEDTQPRRASTMERMFSTSSAIDARAKRIKSIEKELNTMARYVLPAASRLGSDETSEELLQGVIDTYFK